MCRSDGLVGLRAFAQRTEDPVAALSQGAGAFMGRALGGHIVPYSGIGGKGQPQPGADPVCQGIQLPGGQSRQVGGG